MPKDKKKKVNLHLIITALCVFVSCLLIQTHFWIVTFVWIIFVIILLVFTCGLVIATKSFFIVALFVFLSRNNWIIYDSKMISQIPPIVFLRFSISKFYDQIYGINSTVSNCFKLIVLNFKEYQINGLYKTLVDLSLIHLFVTSGFHFNLLFLLFTFWIKRRNWLSVKVLAFTVCLFYGLLLNLTFGILRSLITIFLKNFFKKRQLHGFERLAIAIFIILFLNPNAANNLGFQMSCLGCFGMISANKMSNRFMNSFCGGFLASLLIAPVILVISHTFNVLSFIFSILLSPFFSFFIVFSWFFSWFYFLGSFDVFLISEFENFLNLLSKIGANLRVQHINYHYVIVFYWLVLSGCLLVNMEYNQKRFYLI